MASAWFNKGMYEILSASTNLTSATIKVLMLKDTYTFDAADNIVNDLTPASNEISTAERLTLANKTVTEDDAGGRAYFDNTVDSTFSAVPDQGANQINATVIYREITNDTDSVVLFYNDFTAIDGNGSDITVTWHANGIAEIT